MIYASEKYYRHLMQQVGVEGDFDQQPLAGLRVISTATLPVENPCKVCRGTGEGQTSTYCDRCGGAGKIKVVGIKMTDEPIPRIEGHIVEPVEGKAFQPHWPKDVPVPLVEIAKKEKEE